MNITVISPHVDDAVFSLAESMLSWKEDGHRVTVLSVFAGVPPTGIYHSKHNVLRIEHDRAMEVAGIDHTELGFFDDAVGERYSESAIADAVKYWVDDGIAVWPRGIHHPDHRMLGLVRPRRPGIWTYDEIPYYVLHPEATWRGIERVGYRDHQEEKVRLCHLYRSQINEDLLRCLFVPERVWC